ncbi:MAG TPA: hypothetical protein VGO62_07225 [Myxococcota bacterium]|jgi:hypothetical protein
MFETDTLALTALQALASLVSGAGAAPIAFRFLDGRSFVLDAAQTPSLLESTATSSCATEILCNGAGLMALLQNTLGADREQVFLCRGDRAPLLALADALVTRKRNWLELRTSV